MTSPPTETRTRIGCVSFLNTEPLIAGLEALEGVELARAVPSKLVGLLERDQADVALVSLIDAARSAVPLAVVPSGMIGCDGPTLTVRLYAQVPIAEVTRVHADTDSHTSVALCRLMLEAMHGAAAEVIDYDARERMPLAARVDAAGGEPQAGDEWPEAVLLIGDKVVTDSPPAVRYPYQLDLGEAWLEQTGLPFVYAVWMCRRDRLDDPRVRRAATLLDRQRRHNATRIDQIVTDRAIDHRWPADLARRYIGTCLRFDFDERSRRAAETFLERCEAAGLAPPAGQGHPRLEVADELLRGEA
ncbi:MAG: menaquinone biosynthesis protein [Planctomycetota bacterium]